MRDLGEGRDGVIDSNYLLQDCWSRRRNPITNWNYIPSNLCHWSNVNLVFDQGHVNVMDLKHRG